MPRADLPIDWVVRLEGAAEELEAAFLDAPPDAPALVRYRPSCFSSPDSFVAELLDTLDLTARRLFPAWIPGAEHLARASADEIAAVQAAAGALATRGRHFGPFVSDLAVRSLTGTPPHPGRLPAQTRAAGLALVVADAYGRDATVLVVDVPDGLAPAAQESLVAGCEWFAWHARCGVWLTGAPIPDVDRLQTLSISPAAARPPLIADVEAPAADVPLIAGTPRLDSPSEKSLERALTARPWAVGRVWNQTHRVGPLDSPVRLDLAWFDERVVVEIDGPEHRLASHYESDRTRDVDLQLEGFAVLRFTNAQVERDLEDVVGRIGRMLLRQRQQR